MWGKYITSTVLEPGTLLTMSAPHFLTCICHGYTFLGHVREESQSVENLQVSIPPLLTPMTLTRYVAFRQAGLGIVDLEPIYDSDNQQAPVGPSDLPYVPQVFGTPDVISAYRSAHALGPPLPPRCGCGLCGGLKVPQRPYTPVQMSPDLSQRSRETLTFSKGGCGIRLVEAAQNRLSGLVRGDDLVFVDAPVSTFSLRIEVGG